MKTRSLSPIKPESPAELGIPPGLAVEVAMGLNDVRSICAEYGFDRADWEAIVANPIFVAQYESAMEIKKGKDGMFKLKAKLMADRALDEQFKTMIDKDVAVGVRMKAAENIIQYAELLPKKDVGEGNDQRFSISIDLRPTLQATPDARGIYTIEHEPVTQ